MKQYYCYICNKGLIESFPDDQQLNEIIFKDATHNSCHHWVCNNCFTLINQTVETMKTQAEARDFLAKIKGNIANEKASKEAEKLSKYPHGMCYECPYQTETCQEGLHCPREAD